MFRVERFSLGLAEAVSLLEDVEASVVYTQGMTRFTKARSRCRLDHRERSFICCVCFLPHTVVVTRVLC
jgi:hypothetical protein